jgi:CRP/FNR family cyclic AMP-dependent transcriptional regulator
MDHPGNERISNPERVLARVSGGQPEPRYVKDQRAYAQGDDADYLYYIRTGTAKLAVTSAGGKEAVIAILQPGSFCGEESLSGHKLYLTTMIALTDCTLIRLPKTAAARALREDAEFCDLFVSYLLARNIRVQEDLVDQLLNPTEKRLARVLLILANYGKDDRSDPIIPKISQETLAEMIGTSRTHVNHFMRKFRELGLIEYDGDIRVNRSLLNMLLYDKSCIGTGD